MKVVFKSPEEVSEFAGICGKYDGVDVSVTNKSMTVDGCSVVGILGFGTGKVLDVDIITQDKAAEAELIGKLQKFAPEE